MLTRINVLLFLLVIGLLNIVTSSVAVENQNTSYNETSSQDKNSHSKPYSANSSTKVYHNKECRYFDCNACTVEFDSVEEAEKAGYKPCRLCGSKDLSQQLDKNSQETGDKTKKELENQQK